MEVCDEVCLVALAAARLVLSADFVLQEYLPPDTKVVMGLRVRSFTESSLFADQRREREKR